MHILFGIVTGCAVVFTIKKFEKIDTVYGTLSMPLISLLIFLSICGFCIASISKSTIGEEMVALSSLAVSLWLLLTTSYMDQRCGEFSVVLMWTGLILEIVLLAVALINGYVYISLNYLKGILLVCIMIFITSIKSYTKGDLGIIFTVQFLYLIIYPSYYYMGAVFITIYSGMLLSYIRGIIHAIKNKSRKREMLPFTMYITIGVYLVLYLYR